MPPLSISEDEQKRIFSRRAFIIGAGQGGLLCILAGRLGWLQLAQGEKYTMLSDKNSIDLKMIAPARGRILDRYGKDLATNTQNFRAVIIPEQAKDPHAALLELQRLINLTDDEVSKALKNIKKVAKFTSVEVKDQLTWQDVSKVEVSLTDLPGLSIDVGEVRHYPLGAAAAHIVGYVGDPDEEDVKTDRVLSLPGFKIGKIGVEKQLDPIMRGKAGVSEVEVNVSGREVRELSRKESRKGDDVVLSLDAELQAFVQQRLASEASSTAIIMDAYTGAIYAMASYPAFDPNHFIKGITPDLWQELLNTQGKPMINKALSGQYPPASTFKMMTALAGMKAGIVTPDKKVYCPGHYMFGGQKFHCWENRGHGTVDVIAAIEQSCDVFFYDIAKDIGIDGIAEMARMFGLGSPLGFEIKEERSGLVPDKAWKKANLGQSWTPGETVVASIGQGYLLATPLQLAVMTARLINGGYAVTPWITEKIGQTRIERPHAIKKLEIEPEYLQIIRQGMDNVVIGERGTARGSAIKEPAFAMGGKTGTAQVARITAAQRAAKVKNEDLDWAQRHHALFVGYAPLHAPRYVCSVVVEHGIGGSRAAAPIARDILTEVQKRNPARRRVM